MLDISTSLKLMCIVVTCYAYIVTMKKVHEYVNSSCVVVFQLSSHTPETRRLVYRFQLYSWFMKIMCGIQSRFDKACAYGYACRWFNPSQ